MFHFHVFLMSFVQIFIAYVDGKFYCNIIGRTIMCIVCILTFTK